MNTALDADTVVDAMADAARARRQQALKMKRDEGLTYQQLADRLGMSRQRAHALCKRALKDRRRA